MTTPLSPELFAEADLFHEELETDAEPVELTDEELLEYLPGLGELIDDELARQAGLAQDAD